MTVKELIEELKKYPSNIPVKIFDTASAEMTNIKLIAEDCDTNNNLIVVIQTY